MTTAELLNEVREISTLNQEYIRKKCAHLSDEQLRWQPSESAWSIREVLAHMNKSASFYLPAFSKKIENTRFQEPADSFQSSPLGRASWKSMKLGKARNVKRKFNTLPAMNPRVREELISGNDLEDYLNNASEFLKITEDAASVNIRRVKVPTAVSKIVKFRLGDGLLFYIYHEERHVEQIKRIIEHPKFPKKK